MKELESFRGHQKDVTALAWHPFHEEYFVSGSYDGSIFHWLVGHEAPQVELPGAHEGAVWDLAWHPIGYLLCSGSNDHTTKFWCRNRPGDTIRDKYTGGHNQGFGEQHSFHSSRMTTGFPVPEPPPTPGPFGSGFSRNEGTIPGIGVAMPLSVPLDGSDQAEQRQAIPGILPPGAPPLPPGPHPSLLASNQQQSYQQTPHQFQPPPQQQQQQQQQQQSSFPQQMVQLPLAPQNMNTMQPPSHLPMLPHSHLPRPPPPQIQPLGMPAPVPNSLSGSVPMPHLPMQNMPNPMAMQGPGNQYQSAIPQGHIMGPLPTGNIPPNIGGFPNGMTNIQGGVQNFTLGGMFSRPQGGQMPQIPGLNTFQPGMMGGGNINLPPPPPPGPPPLPQGSAPQ